MASFLGLDRFLKLLKIIGKVGGVRKSLKKLFINDELRVGTLVGTDKYGHKYYQDPYYFYGRNRWVEYASYIHLNYDGSQIPAEWYGWMHYKTDIPPNRDPNRPKHKWMADHTENLTGTKHAYMPYSTVRPKIQAWNPKIPKKKKAKSN